MGRRYDDGMSGRLNGPADTTTDVGAGLSGPPDHEMSEPRILTVEIHGHRYPVRTTLEESYVQELAAFVDGRMRAAADETPSGESIKIAVLAALNIADEYFRYRRSESPEAPLLERTARIERLVDDTLARLT
jgi:cell division protein ZapA